MRHTLAGLSVLVLVAGVAAHASAQSVSFAGSWKLNKEASDDPQAKLHEATEAGPRVSTGMSSGGRIRAGAGRIDGESGGGASAGGRGAGSLPGPDFGRAMYPAEIITVEQNDTILIIKSDRGLPDIVYLDGRKVEEPMPGSEPRITTAKWKDGKLTVERKLGGIGSMKEVFILDSARHRLVVEAKLTSAQLGRTVEVRRVYEAGS